eukprot:7922-Heterococcus_DN1.PRE.6
MWLDERCSVVQQQLQALLPASTTVPWAWVARQLIETLRRFPAGVTEAVLLGELELAWRQHARSAFEPGELRNYVNAEHIPIGAVVQACHKLATAPCRLLSLQSIVLKNVTIARST